MFSLSKSTSMTSGLMCARRLCETGLGAKETSEATGDLSSPLLFLFTVEHTQTKNTTKPLLLKKKLTYKTAETPHVSC